jgi:protein gp37
MSANSEIEWTDATWNPVRDSKLSVSRKSSFPFWLLSPFCGA